MPADPSLQPPPAQSSWPALDIVKCAAVAGMILVHVVCCFVTWAGAIQIAPDDPLIRWVRWGMVIGFLPLILPVTAGCSFYFGLFRDLPIGRLTAVHLMRLFGVSGGLLGFGYFLNFIELGWPGIWVWQILH